MNVAIDYDDTYTLDKQLWNHVIKMFIDAGHNVFCVTKRYEEIADDIREDMNIPIVYATRSKLEAVVNANIRIDVWIDDKPQSIIPYKAKMPLNKGYQRW